jgi:hypothetical protein
MSAGAVHETAMEPCPGVAVTAVGGCGTATGVTAPDGADAAPNPNAFVARTVKVYAVPFVRPATVVDSAPVVVPIAPPGLAVTT